MANSKIPIIALIGQANVGKSSLFNVLLRERRNIVAREAGTTRDSIAAIVDLDGKPAWLVDTAGMKDPEDDFEASIQEQIDLAVESADIICLLVEAAGRLSQTDRSLAKKAMRSKKAVVAIANKVDLNLKATEADFLGLGIKDIFLTSTTTRQGVDALIGHLASSLPNKKLKQDGDVLKIALLGRPNVGKSALFNSLIKKQLAVVAERAGTTRDVNRQLVRFDKQAVELLDTAGIRRSGKIERGVEKFSVLRTLSAIEESDVCLLLLDVNELATAVEQKIAGLVKEAGKGLIIVITKWDTLTDKDGFEAPAISKRLRQEFDFVPWAGLIFTSAVTGRNVAKILELALQIRDRRQQKITTSRLNRCLQDAVRRHPPAGLKNRHPSLNYAVQVSCDPPTFQFFGSLVKYLHWSYKRFLERKLREEFDYQGTALTLIFKEKH
ncbi:ribosome biogenesis GTPase Der [Candidatus Saccharibacteria bacterium]|nr:ribosome biogenesis GTPase Der [Candidatus Saccharibacteria bacterium]